MIRCPICKKEVAPGNADFPEVQECIDMLVDAELVGREGATVVLTRHGRLLANEVAARVLAASDAADRRVGTR